MYIRNVWTGVLSLADKVAHLDRIDKVIRETESPNPRDRDSAPPTSCGHCGIFHHFEAFFADCNNASVSLCPFNESLQSGWGCGATDPKNL